MRRSVLALVALTMLTGLAATPLAAVEDVAAVPEDGQTVPDFSLPIVGGDVVTLSDQVGEGTVVLVFFRGAW